MGEFGDLPWPQKLGVAGLALIVTSIAGGAAMSSDADFLTWAIVAGLGIALGIVMLVTCAVALAMGGGRGQTL